MTIGLTVACIIIAAVLTAQTQSSAPEAPIYDGLKEGWLFAPILVPLAALLAWRRPSNRVTWLIVVIGLIGSLQQVSASYAVEALVVGESLSDGVAAHLAHTIFQMWWVLAMILLLALFPDGHTLSRRWRWLLISIGFLFVALPLTDLLLVEYPYAEDQGVPAAINGIRSPMGAITPLPLVDLLGGVTDAAAIGSIAGVLLSIILRFSRATGVERQQFKWFFYAVVIVVLMWFIPEQFHDMPDPLGLLLSVWAVGPSIILASMALAILRFRLYEIDRIVSRTISYALVIGVLAPVYAVGAMWLPTFWVGDTSPVFVAASTLAVAALFNPVRKRVQAGVERRFDRSRYQAQSVVESFSQSVSQQPDPRVVVSDWVAVVTDSIRPSSLSVWVNDKPTGQSRSLTDS